MQQILSKNVRRQARQQRSRKRFAGTPERPRLNVFRSLQHIYTQIVDDSSGKVLLAVSDRTAGLGVAKGGDLAAARAVGQALAERARAQGIATVVFDRAGYAYHGRVRALAEAARVGGLQF